MARRKARRSGVRGRPNYVWVNTSGEFALVSTATQMEALLIPGDWSGTVTEQHVTLLRMVLMVHTATINETGHAHGENCAIVKGFASDDDSLSGYDISNYDDWASFFAEYDEVLRIFYREWDGVWRDNALLPVQFSTLPEPVLNIKTPRRLTGMDSIRLAVGGGWTQQGTEVPVVDWFCRSLVRIGIR